MKLTKFAAALAATATLTLGGCLTADEVSGLIDQVQHNPDNFWEPVSDPDSLHQRGTAGAPAVGEGWELDNWGLWGSVNGNNIFFAEIAGTYTRGEDDPGSSDPFYRSVTGDRVFTTPGSGSAVWMGSARAYETAQATFGTPVEGSARLEMDFASSEIDVALTSFDRGHADMSWADVPVSGGAFRAGGMDGAFFGSEHQGAAGKFDRDDLRGVFGAIRGQGGES